MRTKLSLILLIVFLITSCSLEDNSTLEEIITNNEKTVTLQVLSEDGFFYSLGCDQSPTLDEDEIYSSLTLEVPSFEDGIVLTLDSSCLGIYHNHIQKLVIGSGITSITPYAVEDETLLEEVNILGETELIDGSFSGCTGIKKFTVNGTDIDFQRLIED